MTYNTASWTNRLNHAVNDLIIRPAYEIKKDCDRALLKVLTPVQLELVYAILKALPLAVFCLMLPPPSGALVIVSLYAVEMLKPNLFSQHTWTALHLSAGLFLLGSLPRVFLVAYKYDSVAVFMLGIARAALGIAITWEAIEYYNLKSKTGYGYLNRGTGVEEPSAPFQPMEYTTTPVYITPAPSYATV